MAPQVGAHCLEKENGGRGVLLGGVPGVPPADVVILGGGVAGTQCRADRVGMGADVTVRRPQSGGAAPRSPRQFGAARAHRVLDPRRGRDAVPARRSRHRRRC